MTDEHNFEGSASRLEGQFAEHLAANPDAVPSDLAAVLSRCTCVPLWGNCNCDGFSIAHEEGCQRKIVGHRLVFANDDEREGAEHLKRAAAAITSLTAERDTLRGHVKDANAAAYAALARVAALEARTVICGYPLPGWILRSLSSGLVDGKVIWLVTLYREDSYRSGCGLGVCGTSDVGPLEAWEQAVAHALLKGSKL